MLADGRVAECARGSEIGDPQLLLEGQAGRHHLPEHADDCGIRQWSVVLVAQAGEHLGLAIRPVRRAAVLGVRTA